MIIGNNNPQHNNNDFSKQRVKPFTNNFDEKFQNMPNTSNNFNMQDDGMRSTSFYDVNSKSEMLDKSYAMLKERYQNGLITLEEFNKKCNKLNKMRNN